MNFDQTPINQNGGAKSESNDLESFTRFGMSPDITANGTYSFDLLSPDDMYWGFMGFNSFSGTITNISVQDIGNGASGPVTVHN